MAARVNYMELEINAITDITHRLKQQYFNPDKMLTTLKIHRYVLLQNRCIESDYFCEYASSCHITNINKPILNATVYRDTCMVNRYILFLISIWSQNISYLGIKIFLNVVLVF